MSKPFVLLYILWGIDCFREIENSLSIFNIYFPSIYVFKFNQSKIKLCTYVYQKLHVEQALVQSGSSGPRSYSPRSCSPKKYGSG